MSKDGRAGNCSCLSCISCTSAVHGGRTSRAHGCAGATRFAAARSLPMTAVVWLHHSKNRYSTCAQETSLKQIRLNRTFHDS